MRRLQRTQLGKKLEWFEKQKERDEKKKKKEAEKRMEEQSLKMDIGESSGDAAMEGALSQYEIIDT